MFCILLALFSLVNLLEAYPHPTPPLTPSHNLSLTIPRTELASVAYGSVILFAGGLIPDGTPTDLVDVYDLSTSTHTVLQLTLPKAFDGGQNVGAVCRARGYIAAGITTDGKPSNVVDVFDFASMQFIAPIHLSQARSFVAVAALEAAGLVLFGGGELSEDEKHPAASVDTSVVDIYSVDRGSWIQPGMLSVPRKKLSASVLDERYVLFAGGFLSNNGSEGYRAEVDMFDSQTGAWSLMEPLIVGRMRLAAASVGSCTAFGGGEINVTIGDASGIVDIYCMDRDHQLKHSVSELSIRRYELSAASIGGYMCFGGGNIGVGGSDTHGALRIDCLYPTVPSWGKINFGVPHVRLASGVADHQVCWAGGSSRTVECFSLI